VGRKRSFEQSPEWGKGNLHIDHQNHRFIMSHTQPKSSFVIRYLGPLVPLGFAVLGAWILFSGSYTYRPVRYSSTVVTLLPPDSWLAAVFFFSLASLLIAFGLQGRAERITFGIGLVGCIAAIAAVGFRQITGLAVVE
jgi:hypothetical protein